jgi:NNP family nitrate/nitrite transporter-like MFS transporter
MAAVLIVGAIPSGLAGTASKAEHLYVLRFFIGILGATFVPCQSWTTAFYDKNVVGTANALVGGWGNLGGGVSRIPIFRQPVDPRLFFLLLNWMDLDLQVTFVVMTALFQRLLDDGLRQHVAWRASFA